MKTTEESEGFDYLKDTLELVGISQEIKDKKLYISAKQNEMYLHKIETYSPAVAMRNNDDCTLTRNQTHFIRLFFKGKMKLYTTNSKKGRSYVKINYADGNSVQCKAKLYIMDESDGNFYNVFSTSRDISNPKYISNLKDTEDFKDPDRPNVDELILDGNNTYFIAIYNNYDAKLMGMSCEVADMFRPYIAFDYRGETGDNFHVFDPDMIVATQTYSIELVTEEFNDAV